MHVWRRDSSSDVMAKLGESKSQLVSWLRPSSHLGAYKRDPDTISRDRPCDDTTR
jgi:hypothetical protein